jgi:hypothetical protein
MTQGHLMTWFHVHSMFILVSARDCNGFLLLLLVSGEGGLYKTKYAFARTLWLNVDWVKVSYCSESSLSTTYCWLMREWVSKWGRGRVPSPHCQIFLFLLLGQLTAMPQIPYVYDFITKLCRQQAEIIQYHDDENVRYIGQGEARHRKYKRLKLGGGHVYDRSSV